MAKESRSQDGLFSDGPIGFLPLFDGTVVDHQLRIVRRLGAKKVIFLSPTSHGALLQYVDRLSRDEIAVEFVRSAKELTRFSSGEDEIVYIGDGVIPGEKLVEQLSQDHRERLFVVDNAEENAQYERIDLNHRWLEIAQLKASRLAMLREIPDDWDIGSALLRISVQAGCSRELISGTALAGGAMSHLHDRQQLAAFEQKLLAHPDQINGNFLQRYIIAPIKNRLIRQLWKNRGAGLYLKIFIFFTTIAAALCAWLEAHAIALLLLTLVSLAQSLLQQIGIFSVTTRQRNYFGITIFSLVTICLYYMIFFLSNDYAVVANSAVFCGFFASLWLVGQQPGGTRLELMRPDLPSILLLLFCFTMFGNLLFGLYLAYSWTIVYLVVERLLASRHQYEA